VKNRILILLAGLLIIILVVVRYFFEKKLVLFKSSIANYEQTQLDNFTKEREKRVFAVSLGDTTLCRLFTEQYDLKKAYTEKDTDFSFFYLSESVKYKIPLFEYLDCLGEKCAIDYQNLKNLQMIHKVESQLQNKFGESFSRWYPKFKETKLETKTDTLLPCSKSFPGTFAISYNEDAWIDFSNFLVSYDDNLKKAEIENKQSATQYKAQKERTRSQLNRKVIEYFDTKLSETESRILTTDSEQRTYNSPLLGIVTYNICKKNFKQAEFQTVADDAYEEQWKYNSLYTGAMPYSYCYGSNNYCDYYGCSKISVKTGRGADVLVTIKNNSGAVVRHAYIRGGDTFEFNVSDGGYQVFFYSGNGWNPNKLITNSSCGQVKGGFVSDEDVTKSEYSYLQNKIHTYELIPQEFGNFKPQKSSIQDAF
jgi:hypothetical protein